MSALDSFTPIAPRCIVCGGSGEYRCGPCIACKPIAPRPEPSAPSTAGVEVAAIGYASDYGLGKLASKAHHYCLSVNKALEKEFVNPIYGPEAIATLTASLDQATRRAEDAREQSGHARDNFLIMQGTANKLRIRAEAAEARVTALEQDRQEIRRRVRNIWGAISSNQVEDKDVLGQAKRLLDYIDEALSSTASSITEKETPDA